MKTSGFLLLTGLTVARCADTRPRAAPIKEHYKEKSTFSKLWAAAPIGQQIIRAAWKVTCDSYEPGYECQKAIDGNNQTMWHTAFNNANVPHQIVIDMGVVKNINGLSALPRQDGNRNGFIAQHEVSVSTDNANWETVAAGTWYSGDTEARFANFETRAARYVRLKATSEANGNRWTSLSELDVYESKTGPTPYSGKGKWGPTIDFPTVPVAGTVDPFTGQVLIWASYSYDNLMGSTGDRVFTSIWDPATNIVTPKVVDNTDHDMFCPGISVDGSGKMVVTGGNSAKKTSLYDYRAQTWIPGPDMNTPRGYQATAALSNGNVFVIGGCWSGGWTEKNGELYDFRAQTWTRLDGALVKPILTNDAQGIYRADNHAMLFGWKQGSVFHAGPSTAMHWYNTTGSGSITPAGQRGSDRGADPDSMTGNAVMFDATRGKLLVFGGSPSYQDSAASAHAHLVTIGEPGSQAQVQFASQGMYSARAFHTSVVLPDGTVFITGGQSYASPFSDNDAQLTPELYDPVTDHFYQQQPNSIIRVYHSISLLLPDGRVFNAGGGLCGDCHTNHFDAQIYTPQYLLTSTGEPATRPVIRSVAQNGRRITIATDSAVTAASLIRYSTNTHTVNTDQRRIPLTLKRAGANKYTADAPNDSGILLPGHYMLFVLNSNGVPSVAKTVSFLL
ncbi:uncharacterized protein UV8b_05223 [Ustilaginoidea virens]|uniref:F5/8 type C domain-containing protein n=1 Tax=Ustilaginoidea virens TaxID=1159556 RepID=A0A8E5HT14_USTVR|nr:uncharacterized protein UV8b_05223 [Ustilaginoidea virens]QUC20982.1 hypothetical protein UV8b_05223 [Ustilaginoidea virens]